MSDTKTTKPEEKKAEPPFPPVVVFGPQGCGKTTLADLMMKFFGTTKLVDDWKFEPKLNDAGSCDFSALQKGTLYLSNAKFDQLAIKHAAVGHEVVVIDFYTVLRDLGGARGRNATTYYTELMFSEMLSGILGGGRKRPRSPLDY